MIIAVLAAIGWDSLWPRLWDARPARRRLAHWASLLVLGLIVWELGTFSASLCDDSTDRTASRLVDLEILP